MMYISNALEVNQSAIKGDFDIFLLIVYFWHVVYEGHGVGITCSQD